MMDPNEVLETGKMLSDFFKQMLTLDTGMVLLIVTMVEKIFTPERFFKKRFNIIILSICLISFITSLYFSLRALMVIANRVLLVLQNFPIDSLVDKLSIRGSIYSFFAGVILFLGLALIIFSSSSIKDTGRQ